ncbi:aminoglycoside phosphotransferase family protein [Coleofasciculus sp. FACHB-1120]|uniref:phosphotransferase family protein n=1 Tax=Coleofasciculus sp. FACHB-1120 TaxID=2692783 RepID=UPI00168768CF|nr:aminoglycoside phosphotransferase family protein [Coleofasciculus sp. FACHB-1120]MBD2744710.1 aminoglycoside phosphotransferase family protein [Coleofasciculus sp. FACHB-1120]
MTFLLNSHNVFDYLVDRGFCTHSEQALSKVEPIAAKNFNLLVSLSNGRKLLVKQERHNQEGKAAAEFLNEWRIQEFLQQLSELGQIQSWIPVVLHFDAEHSIIIFSYLDEYRDLADFYGKENVFPTKVTHAIATILATVHRDTFNRQNYQDFFSSKSEHTTPDHMPNLIRSLERIGPEIFGQVPTDGLKFFALYQRYDSLGQAIRELTDTCKPCCLTHNDLKLNNILLHKDWEQAGDSIVRLIDWERSTWGDPAFDFGTLIASYLQLWLGSLVMSQSLTIEESLRLAAIPLEQLQPSIAALTSTYLDTFPEILEHRPDFLRRVVQFAGFALIQQIQAMIQYQKSFGNTGIAMLQVAKTLLCRPEQSMPTIFGAAAVQLTQLHAAAV